MLYLASASCIFVGSLVSLRSWDPSSPSTTAFHLLQHGKKKKKRLSGTIKIPVDCRSCDLTGALTYCSFLSPYLGFVGIKCNQEKQKTKPVLVCLLIFGFVFTFARAKHRKWSKRYFQTYTVTWFRITDSKSVCKNKMWLPLPALRGTVSERPHLALVIRKLNKILETTVFRSWTAGHAGLSS